ncbi:MAG: hypothetical protein K8W52_22770 [Deltaproteobacteria bacterium]|nr:hypothetical protein [Deltaproteobacteria bacterium]
MPRTILASVLLVPLWVACSGPAVDPLDLDSGSPPTADAITDASPDGAPDASPDAMPLPDGPTLAHVVIHTAGDHVLFHRADGTLFANAATVGGVVVADVPPGSMATSVAPAGTVTPSSPQPLFQYDSATALVDGDEITLGAPAVTALPDVTVTPPPAPADAPDLQVAFCDYQRYLDGPTRLDRSRCGARTGAILLAFRNFVPAYTIVVPDLGTGAIDLSSATWQPLGSTTLTVSPPPTPTIDPPPFRITWVNTNGMLDHGQFIGGIDYVGVEAARSTAPTIEGGHMMAQVYREGGIGAHTEDQVVVPSASALTFDLAQAQFPAITARLVGGSGFALDGDIEAHREATTIVTYLRGATASAQWNIHLRGHDTAFTVPSEGLVATTITWVALSWTLTGPNSYHHRQITFQ